MVTPLKLTFSALDTLSFALTNPSDALNCSSTTNLIALYDPDYWKAPFTAPLIEPSFPACSKMCNIAEAHYIPLPDVIRCSQKKPNLSTKLTTRRWATMTRMNNWYSTTTV